MSILEDKKELKNAAQRLPYAKLVIAADVLNALIKQRGRETDVINRLQALAKSSGYSLESLGFVSDQSGAGTTEKMNGRPVKPKLKSINAEKQHFYFENGTLRLLPTHTMKKALNDRGIDIIPAGEISEDKAGEVKALIDAASAQAIINFNTKVDVWNAWAAENGGEVLAKR